MSLRKFVRVVLCVAACAALSGCFLFQNRPPVAALAVHYNVNPEDPMVVDLDASASSDPDGDAMARYLWTFSDDLAIVEPLAYSTSVEHPILRVRCPNEGQYTATLVVVDANGLSSEPVVGTVIVPQPLP